MSDASRDVRRELTVRLDRLADGRSLRVGYQRQPYGEVASAIVDLLAAGVQVKRGDAAGIAAIDAALDTGNGAELRLGLTGKSGDQIGAMLDDFQWATHTIHASYSAWSTEPTIAVRPPPEAHLRLDRDAQRAQVERHVAALVEGRRVEAMVAYGAPGNLVDQFSHQAMESLDARRVTRHRRIEVRFPDERKGLAARLEATLRLHLDADSAEATRYLLRRKAPSAGLPGKPLLWLDWGTFGGNHQSALLPSELKEWLTFSRDVLVQHCPEEMCIVSYLAIETAQDKLAGIDQLMKRHAGDLFTNHFRCRLLPALPRVEYADLLDFLTDTRNTRCPRCWRRRPPDCSMRSTGANINPRSSSSSGHGIAAGPGSSTS